MIKKSKINNQGSKVIIESTISKSLREPQTMDELLAQIGGLVLGLKKGTTIDGTVISVTPREVLVDIGKKSFGIIAEWELEQVKD